jgi:hypothetical protein
MNVNVPTDPLEVGQLSSTSRGEKGGYGSPLVALALVAREWMGVPAFPIPPLKTATVVSEVEEPMTVVLTSPDLEGLKDTPKGARPAESSTTEEAHLIRVPSSYSHSNSLYSCYQLGCAQ